MVVYTDLDTLTGKQATPNKPVFVNKTRPCVSTYAWCRLALTGHGISDTCFLRILDSVQVGLTNQHTLYVMGLRMVHCTVCNTM